MRNRITKRVSKAFTLVEILIVVVILGILAAIVVPQFANATKDSQAGNIKAQIKSVSNQLELYKARVGAYPSETELNTDSAGGVVGSGWGPMIDGSGIVGGTGGYLKAAPKNPAISDPLLSSKVGARTLQADGQIDVDDGASGWAYDEGSGDFGANNFNEATGEVILGNK